MSSEPEIAVRVRGLGKSYTIARQTERHITLAESLLARVRRPFTRTQKETFWALKDIDFDIKKGDVVGIIGRNGAGKSTLLKILSRITEPTVGQIDLYGRVGSLLEVGTGFHPELTGRENIFLNGAILGMTKGEIRRELDAIIDFAGVEKFINTPVKRYSSGMYVRLAFSVAAHLRSEILIIDEVLAVGDITFQEKCIDRMSDISRGGRTVLFVSHSMHAIEALCTSGIVMDGGEVIAFGDSISDCIRIYTAACKPTASSFANDWVPDQEIIKHRNIDLRNFRVAPQNEETANIFDPAIRLKIYITITIEELDPGLTLGYALYTSTGHLLYYSLTSDGAKDTWPPLQIGENRLIGEVPSNFLNEGDYKIEFIASLHCREWIYKLGASPASIYFSIEGRVSKSPLWLGRREGDLAPQLHWQLNLTY